MRYSDSISNIATALCQVQREIKNPIKNQTNKGVQGAPKYANLEDTLEIYVRPVLAKHGMSFVQSLKTDEQGRVGVCTTLLHESGEYIESDYVFCEVKIPISNQGKEILTQGQATGVNITYLRRYSLNSALGINGDNDTDGSYGKFEDNEIKTADDARAFVIGFGKHNGKTLGELYDTEPNYIEWLMSNERTDAELKKAIGILNDTHESDFSKEEHSAATIEERKKNVNIKLDVLAGIKNISADDVKKTVIDKTKADENTVDGLIKIEAMLAHWISQASAKDGK